MSIENNPFLQVPNPFEEVQTSQNAASREALEFQKLCWTVFHVEPSGKRLMELLKERYLLRPLFSPDHPQGQNQAMFWEGFREAIRSFHNYGLQHQLYINGVTNNGTSNPATSAASVG